MKKIILLLTVLVVYSLSMSATVIQIAEGTDVIETAIGTAAAGDTIELTTSGGDYAQGEFTIGKSITVRAAAGLAAKPIITGESDSKAIFKVADSYTLVLEGLEITYGKYAIRCTSQDSTTTTSVKVNDCYGHTFKERFLMIDAGDETATGMDSVIIRNSVFADILKEAIVFYYGSSSKAGIPMNYAEVSNCTFNTIGREAIKSQTSEVGKVRVNQCTFYNCGTSGKSMLYFSDLADLEITNCIFMKNTYGSYWMSIEENNKVNNVVFYDVANTKIQDAEEENITDTLYIDPLFIDADNGDFTLQLSSPALTYGDMGQAVGDTRWVVEATGFTFSPKTLSFEAGAAFDTVMFSSDVAWTIAVEASASSWLSVDKASGASTTAPEGLEITALENMAFVARSAKVYGYLAGVVEDSIVVTQAAKIALEIVSKDDMDFPGAGATRTVTINAGLGWTISNGGNAWITFDPAFGNTGDAQVIDIIVAANDGDYRTDTVIIVAGSSTEEIIITQLRAPLTPEWTVYDCSVLPRDYTPAFVLDDDDSIVSEQILNDDVFELAIGDDAKDVYERFDFEDDATFDTYDGFTLMTRIQGHLDSSRVIEIELKGGEYREKLKIEDDRIKADKGKTESGSGEIKFAETTDIINSFVTLRMAYQRGTTRIWVDEVYLGTFVSTTTDGKGELFGFGDSSDSYSYGVDIDWIIWDITGAYAPNEGASLPEGIQVPTIIDVEKHQEALLVYPNPSHGAFVIANSKGQDIQVLSLDGKVVFRKALTSDQEQVNLNVKTGIYLIKVGTSVSKISVK